jgi:type VI secretion system secreted protein VgrG
MKRQIYSLILYSLTALSLYATPILGTANSFSVLGDTTVANTGATILSGNLGLYPGTVISGFPPGIVNGTTYVGAGLAQQAETDALAAYNSLANPSLYPPTQDLTGQDLGGKTLTPGVYTFNSSAQLTGQLTLNTQGNPNALFIFVIGSTLTTASSSSVITTNGTVCCNVYWVVGSSATLGTSTDFLGNILADQSITLTTGANIIDGSALALNGAVTLDDNNISNGCAIPEPGTVALLGAGLLGLVLFGRPFWKRAA